MKALFCELAGGLKPATRTMILRIDETQIGRERKGMGREAGEKRDKQSLK